MLDAAKRAVEQRGLREIDRLIRRRAADDPFPAAPALPDACGLQKRPASTPDSTPIADTMPPRKQLPSPYFYPAGSDAKTALSVLTREIVATGSGPDGIVCLASTRAGLTP